MQSTEEGTEGSAGRTAIRRLDDVTISRIAAGEVVERPASVVKELIENSLDAGATRIEVEVREGGKRSIAVRDDGRGIPAGEVELALERHATSKLRDGDGLETVASLGFRGEALAAIAAVSELTLTTRVEGEASAVVVRASAGRISHRGRSASPVGTRISVENLFAAVPARRRFLKGEASESARITEVVVRYALAYPDRAFRLVRNGREALRTDGRGDARAALLCTLEQGDSQRMLEAAFSRRVDAGEAPGRGAPIEHLPERLIRVRGFVSPPDLNRGNRSGIALFVNGRWINDGRLQHAIVSAYRGLLPQRRFPVAILFIEIPADAIDVNVHPAKTEVRFRDAGAVYGAVEAAVRGAVSGAPPAVAPGTAFDGRGRELWRPPSDELWTSRSADVDATGGLRFTTSEASMGYAVPGGRPEAPEPCRASGATGVERNIVAAAGPASAPESAATGDRVRQLRPLGQVGLAYIVANGPDGMYVIDQHAAHERIMFERLSGREGQRARQVLLKPALVKLTPTQSVALQAHAPAIEAAGFEVEPFGPDTALVRGVPEVLIASDASAAVRDLLDGLDDPGTDDLVGGAIEARIVRMVCKRASVKAGQRLDVAEMRALIADLAECASPLTCPHGRPTLIAFDMAFLARAFGRS